MRSEALKETQKRYFSKLKRVEIQFSPSEEPLYNKLQERAEKEKKSVNAVVKDMIREL